MRGLPCWVRPRVAGNEKHKEKRTGEEGNRTSARKSPARGNGSIARKIRIFPLFSSFFSSLVFSRDCAFRGSFLCFLFFGVRRLSPFENRGGMSNFKVAFLPIGLSGLCYLIR